MLSAPEHQEMNRQVEVTWITLRTISHYIMVYDIFSEAYIHFALIYTTYHIFPVLPIRNLINKDGELTTPFKLVTGTKPSVSHLRVLFFPCVVRKATAHIDNRALNMCHQAQKRFSWNLCWNSTVSKRLSCVCNKYNENNIFI